MNITSIQAWHNTELKYSGNKTHFAVQSKHGRTITGLITPKQISPDSELTKLRTTADSSNLQVLASKIGKKMFTSL
jgi:hypothetical protein